MEIKVTLFKSGFTPQNVFVGNGDAAQRRAALFTLPKLELPQCPFNPEDPYRLEGNILLFRYNYDYAEYQYISDSNTEYRYFFITDFVYINDSVTRLTVIEDIISPLFYNLNLKEYYPENCTYKKSELSHVPIDIKDNIEYYTEDINYFNGIQQSLNDWNGTKVIPGFIIATIVTPQTKSGDLDISRYIENGTEYTCATILLPFLYYPFTQQLHIKTDDFYIKPAKTEILIRNSHSYSILFTTPSLTVVSTTISWDLPLLFNWQFRAGVTGKPRNVLLTPNSSWLTIEAFSINSISKALAISELRKNTYEFNIVNELNPLIFSSRKPFKKIIFKIGGNIQEIDPYFIRQMSRRIYLTFSLVPPYSYTVWFDPESNRQNPFTFTNLQLPLGFMSFNNAYKEWIESNYNSVVMGLELQQRTERQQQVLKIGSGILSTTIHPLGAFNAVRAITDTAGLAIKQNEQKQMVDYKIKDLQNIPNKTSFISTIQYTLNNEEYPRISLYTNTFLPELIKRTEYYGISCVKKTDLKAKHNLYDYYSGTDFILEYKGLSQIQRNQIYESFNNGVRIWYTLDNFLNFDIPNREVS